MKVYIRSVANISPQNTFGNISFLNDAVEYNSVALKAIEPDYKKYIDAKLIRRMSRIIRMGVAAASQCLQDAGEKEPSAIITGTAYGALEDTGTFLSRMIELGEQMLSPTAFIQSTHNTIAAQIALLLQCTNYNNTFVHGAFSFESALLDSIMLLRENEAQTVLAGGIDEITDNAFAILKRFGLYKREPMSNLSLLSTNTRGSIAGEGTAFFLLAKEASEKDYATLDAVATFYKPKTHEETAASIHNFLQMHSVNIDDVDLIISGRNGDASDGKVYDVMEKGIFANKSVICFKHLCGEYPTATSFAMWLAAKILKSGEIPAITGNTVATGKPKRILVYNHYMNTHHSVLLLSA